MPSAPFPVLDVVGLHRSKLLAVLRLLPSQTGLQVPYALFMSHYLIVEAAVVCLQRDTVLLLRDVFVCIERLPAVFWPFSPVDMARQRLVVGAEGEQLEVHRPNVHGRHPAYIAVVLVLLYEQDGFRFAVQFRIDMPSCVLIAFVLVQYRVDMYLAVVRPLHQLGDDACGFAGAVDVIHHVAGAVYHDKPQFRDVVDGLLHSRDVLFRSVLAQGEKFEVIAVPVCRQFRRVRQYRVVQRLRRDDGGDVERLLAFRLAEAQL